MPLLIGPLLLLFGGFNDPTFLLLMLLGGLFVLFVLPRLVNNPAPAYAESDYDKPKNDEYLDKPKNDEYLDEPKNDDYIVGADGEVLEVIDADDPNDNSSSGDR